MRGFYASERVLTYFRDVDPAFIDQRMAGEDARPVVDSWLERVRCPALPIAGGGGLGSALDDNSEGRPKKAVRDLTVKGFPGTGPPIPGYPPRPFLDARETCMR